MPVGFPFSSGGGSLPLSGGITISQIGDSQEADSTTIGQYINSGGMTMARQFSGQRINFPIANNHAIGGTGWGNASIQLAAALLDKPQVIYMDFGTNDSNTGNAGLTASLNNMYATVKTCFANNVIPLIRLIPPRSDAGGTTAAFQWMESYNGTVRDMCAGRADLINTNGLPLNKLAICIDTLAYPAYTATNGTCNPGMIGTDGLHVAFGAGVVDGYNIAQILDMIRPQLAVNYSSPYDIYDAANLINGSLMNFGAGNLGMFQGTGGALTPNGGITPTGSIAPNWQLVANTSITSVGTTAVAYKENPRQDGLVSGERQGIILNSTSGGGAAQEIYGLNFINGNQGMRGSYAAGDIVVATVKCQIKSAVNLQGIQLGLSEFGPVSPQAFLDGVPASNTVGGIGTLQYPQLLQPFILQSPPMVLQAGNTDLYFKISNQMYGAGSSYNLNALFSDARTYKIVPQ